VKYCKKNDFLLKQIESNSFNVIESQNSDILNRRRSGKMIDEKYIEKSRNFGPKPPKFNDYQFMNEKRLIELWEKENTKIDEEEENENLEKKENEEESEKKSEINMLTEEEKKEREELLKEGFSNWNKKDYLIFLKLNEKYGRDNLEMISKGIEGKSEEEVKRYFHAFWKNFKKIHDYDKVVKKIYRGESLIKKVEYNNKILQMKTKKYKNPFKEMDFSYGQYVSKNFTADEDAFMICFTAKFGYGNWSEVLNEIKNCWEFRFDWFIKTRNTNEIQKRIDLLIKVLEKEFQNDNEINELKRKLKFVPQLPNKKRKKNENDYDDEEIFDEDFDYIE
jgi:SWI/SNF-related matrix-associated actin-dependent regulator of chromatin subfamily A member 5